MKVVKVAMTKVERYLMQFARPLPLLEKIRRAGQAVGRDRVSLKEINREIKAYRREQRLKQSATPTKPGE
jgi:hypothetical protein